MSRWMQTREKYELLLLMLKAKLPDSLSMRCLKCSEFPKAPLNPLPRSIVIEGIDSEYITGVSKLDDKLLILLDFNKILSKREQQALAEVKE